jgi:hypothetical protein
MPNIEYLEFTARVFHHKYSVGALDVPWDVGLPFIQHHTALPALREWHFKLHVHTFRETRHAQQDIVFPHFRQAIETKFGGIVGAGSIKFSVYDDSVDS